MKKTTDKKEAHILTKEQEKQAIGIIKRVGQGKQDGFILVCAIDRENDNEVSGMVMGHHITTQEKEKILAQAL